MWLSEIGSWWAWANSRALRTRGVSITVNAGEDTSCMHGDHTWVLSEIVWRSRCGLWRNVNRLIVLDCYTKVSDCSSLGVEVIYNMKRRSIYTICANHNIGYHPASQDSSMVAMHTTRVFAGITLIDTKIIWRFTLILRYLFTHGEPANQNHFAIACGPVYSKW